MKMAKKLIALTLSVIMAISMSVPVFAKENCDSYINTEFTAEVEETNTTDTNDMARSAGLAWGPVTVGNVRLYMTNVHSGPVPGLSGNVSHVNFHADNAKTKKPILNYHIVKYTSGNSECLYVYDSVSRKVIINNCYNGWTAAAGAVVSAVQSAVKAVLSEADWLATAAIWAVVIVVVADLIIPMDPVPVIPFSIDTPEETAEYENDLVAA